MIPLASLFKAAVTAYRRMWPDAPRARLREDARLSADTAILGAAAAGWRQVTILYMGANASDSDRLALGREVRELRRRLRSSECRDVFRVEQEWAVQASDLQELLLRHRPAIVHFGGHGDHRGGLLLESEDDMAVPVTASAFADLFRILGEQVRCVVLNACWSGPQAAATAEHVDCVVSISRAIWDDTAIAFTSAFYRALGYGEDVQTAFELGCNEIGLKGLPDADAPRLVVRPGVNPRALRLIPDRRARG